MKYFLVVIATAVLAGCVSVEIDPSLTREDMTTRPVSSIDEVKAGMAVQEMERIMGESLIIGYKKSETTQGAFEPVTIPSPHKSEQLTVNGDSYRIDYYYTGVYKPDGIISEEELTPVVIKDGVVQAKGWSARQEIENN